MRKRRVPLPCAQEIAALRRKRVQPSFGFVGLEFGDDCETFMTPLSFFFSSAESLNLSRQSRILFLGCGAGQYQIF